MVGSVAMSDNGGELMQLCLVLLFIGLLVLPPAEQEEEDEGPNDDDGRHSGPERGPIEL